MDFKWVKNHLEKTSASSNDTDSTPLATFEPLIKSGLKVDLVERGRVICSMKVPPRLLNADGLLHGGATAALVDVVGGVVIPTINNATSSGVSMEINVSYLDSAYVGDEIEIEAKTLRVGKVVAVSTVEFRNRKTGNIFAQGRHTKYLVVSSKL
ncbi:putative acyl-CoA hydrolase [Helianthus annuus]|uniref:Acyl-coenzyme A thioesterase 13 n=1 Tax=Helianthus annuus TaxID=4232 RepID=A0A251SF02_HELAN|nr:acyl-coenzyme A thioesterase 13 [Helianthus annuus]KAF5768108.1 putative acyl-CoA hydrolase [Helianthus annuus]KAJ0463443.1 putative acyl-CoA hydrolase [Helianthus annuus]KAJ0467551.1 putative acyl-CoA hydrolase [Helianthus annuus]KAJ0484908.1 putative acyl-CoA hydrolase [Helianthus annuus]KAJ0655458.1 putative acyl-CoA hydrolase [Helianthus annuus]